MATLKLKPGVVTGNALQELFAYCKEAKCALPAVNVIGSHTANAALEAAREAKSPIIVQLSQSGSAFYAGNSSTTRRSRRASRAPSRERCTFARWPTCT